MFIYIEGKYRNLEQAQYVMPVLKGTRCQVVVKYPDMLQPAIITDQQANGVLEYVLRRRVACTNDALDTIFQAVKESEDLTENHNGNGHHETPIKRRKPRVVKNPELTRRRCSVKAYIRWSIAHGDKEKYLEWAQIAREMGLEVPSFDGVRERVLEESGQTAPA